MIGFLIKSSLCLAILLGVYILFLEKEKMNVFNRVYLLASLAVSFAIPFIQFEPIHEELQQNLIPYAVQTIQAQAISIEQQSDYSVWVLWILYGTITSLFLFRFIKNLLSITKKIQSNPKKKFEISTLVLVKEKIVPHTFLNYIFINEEDYENRNVEEELYTHELTHVRQKHTIDVLVIEILKTLFWFNPILIFYKKAIQLNHEFLADAKVVKSYNNVPFYQSLLLEKASWNSNSYLASNLNFLVTKKRLIMMTKTTSKSRALLTKLSVLPILAGLISFSCFETDNQKEVAEVVAKKQIIKAEEPTMGEQETQKVYEVSPGKSDDGLSVPKFPGGLQAFFKFVKKEYKIPSGFKGKGNLIASFVVETDGSLSDIKIVKDLGKGTAEEFLRLLKTSPKWQPGTLNGKAVRVKYNVPIHLNEV
jgi:beta-lactamase regulating signal transducer with metallopeptidase domain